MIGPITFQRWIAAAQALGIDVAVNLDASGFNGPKLIECIVVRNFGALNGTIIVTNYAAIDQFRDLLLNNGYAISTMYEPSAAVSSDLAEFIDVLADWTWTGPVESRPTWLPKPCNPAPAAPSSLP